MTWFLFDLDGTLTESGEGIMRSVQYALEKLGRPEPDLSRLRPFIGPPLVESFMKNYGFDRETAESGVTYYRERFRVKGIFENALYPGIDELLNRLKNEGYGLAIASSKPEPFIHQITEYFHIDHYFREMVGSRMDGGRMHKDEVIEEALKRLHLEENLSDVYMIGDKEHDVLGARKAGIRCIAVGYGYGTAEELSAAEPFRTAQTVEELKDILLSL